MIIHDMTAETEMIDGFVEDAEAAIARGAIAKAKTLYQGILRLDGTHLEALSQLAAIALSEEDAKTALALFSLAVENHSREADVHHGLAAAFKALGEETHALQSLTTALRIEPGHEPALFDKARLLQTQGKLHQAERLYLKLASKNETRVDAIFNRGVVMFRKGNLKAAERWFRQAAKLDPGAPRPLINMALIYRYWGHYDAADRCLRHVLESHPDFAEAHWNLANLELLRGDFASGFKRSEWRFKRAGYAPPARDLPKWEGNDPAGKKILLVAEQGLGDTIQFIRFAQVLAEQGATVGVEAQASLRALLATAPGLTNVFEPGADVSGYDVWLPIMSLPAVLGTTLETIPGQVPYLRGPADNGVMSLPDKCPKIGFVWQGNPNHVANRYRSIPVQFWAPVVQVAGPQFVSLQVGVTDPSFESLKPAAPIFDAAPLLKDFAVTASLISQLDLVITVDTAVAHLAGALGKPVWLVISAANDWRWQINRTDTPWYPTMRLFRSRRPRDWEKVMTKVAAALSERVSQPGPWEFLDNPE